MNNSNIDILTIALGEFGIKEREGEEYNSPRILHYAREIGHAWVKTDETAWCSIFMNYVAMMAGCERSNALDARSWLKVGEQVSTPQIGDIAILWRESPNSSYGHVGIVIRETRDCIYLLGGNQKNMVCIMPFPKERLLQYRRLNQQKVI